MSKTEPTTNGARRHMTEKLGWAERSLERMRAAAKNDHVEIQDHFWSYLHAARLVWFYFARWIRAGGGIGGEAKRLMQRWEADHLTADERRGWAALRELRTRDVHVEPVPTEQREGRAIGISADHKLLIRDNKVVIVRTFRYEVEYAGHRLEVFALCEQGITLLRRFVSEFDSLPSVSGPAKSG